MVLKGLKKLQFTRWGVILHEVSSHGSPTSKKHRALDVVQRLKKRNHDQDEVQFEKLNVDTKNDSHSDDSDTRIEDSFHVSPQKDTPIKSIFEETRILDVTTHVADMGKNIDSGEQKPINIYYKATIIPSGVSHTKSIREEVETPDINAHLSDKDTNVNMDEGMNTLDTIIALTTTEASTALPPPTSPITSSIHITNESPNFDGFMKEPITTLFSS